MIVEAALIGVAAGAVSGMLGVGGGILFVPALVLVLGLSQVEGEATSLLAILPVALVVSPSSIRPSRRRSRTSRSAVPAMFTIEVESGMPQTPRR